MKFTIQQIRDMANDLASKLRDDFEDYTAFVYIGTGWYAIAETWEDVHNSDLVVMDDGSMSDRDGLID